MAGDVRKGRVYKSPLAATGVLSVENWIKDDLPDLLWPALVLAERGNDAARMFVKWQEAVQKMSNSSTTTEADPIEPVHLGEILMEDFIEGFGITQNKLAVSIGVPPRRINEFVHGKCGATADTAIRLARYFGTSEEFWMNLQSNYELWLERRNLRDKIASIVPLQVA